MDTTAIKLAEHENFVSERLLLRKIKISDAEDIFEISGDPEVAEGASYSVYEDLERTKSEIVKNFIPDSLFTWAIVEKNPINSSEKSACILRVTRAASGGRLTANTGGRRSCRKLPAYCVILPSQIWV